MEDRLIKRRLRPNCGRAHRKAKTEKNYRVFRLLPSFHGFLGGALRARMGFYLVLPGFVPFHLVSLGRMSLRNGEGKIASFTGRFLLVTCVYWFFLPSFTTLLHGSHLLTTGSDWFYLVLLGFTLFYLVSLGRMPLKIVEERV